MKIITESYDALGKLQPIQELDIASSFEANIGPEVGMPECIVLGLWIKLDKTRVEPRYLTQEQLSSIKGESS
jgi:hypothetical protein